MGLMPTGNTAFNAELLANHGDFCFDSLRPINNLSVM